MTISLDFLFNQYDHICLFSKCQQIQLFGTNAKKQRDVDKITQFTQGSIERGNLTDTACKICNKKLVMPFWALKLFYATQATQFLKDKRALLNPSCARTLSDFHTALAINAAANVMTMLTFSCFNQKAFGQISTVMQSRASSSSLLARNSGGRHVETTNSDSLGDGVEVGCDGDISALSQIIGEAKHHFFTRHTKGGIPTDNEIVEDRRRQLFDGTSLHTSDTLEKCNFFTSSVEEFYKAYFSNQDHDWIMDIEEFLSKENNNNNNNFEPTPNLSGCHHPHRDFLTITPPQQPLAKNGGDREAGRHSNGDNCGVPSVAENIKTVGDPTRRNNFASTGAKETHTATSSYSPSSNNHGEHPLHPQTLDEEKKLKQLFRYALCQREEKGTVEEEEEEEEERNDCGVWEKNTRGATQQPLCYLTASLSRMLISDHSRKRNMENTSFFTRVPHTVKTMNLIVIMYMNMCGLQDPVVVHTTAQLEETSGERRQHWGASSTASTHQMLPIIHADYIAAHGSIDKQEQAVDAPLYRKEKISPSPMVSLKTPKRQDQEHNDDGVNNIEDDDDSARGMLEHHTDGISHPPQKIMRALTKTQTTTEIRGRRSSSCLPPDDKNIQMVDNPPKQRGKTIKNNPNYNDRSVFISAIGEATTLMYCNQLKTRQSCNSFSFDCHSKSPLLLPPPPSCVFSSTPSSGIDPDNSAPAAGGGGGGGGNEIKNKLCEFFDETEISVANYKNYLRDVIPDVEGKLWTLCSDENVVPLFGTIKPKPWSPLSLWSSFLMYEN